jgi:anti-sigma regulatory factor (Ser/Thr protein kinase)
MGQLRAAVRAYARLDLPPAEVLELLDDMLCQLTPGQLATCIYGVYDPVSREFRFANAGHLPPLVTSPGEAVKRLPIATAPPLGVGSAKYDEHRVKLPGEALLTLYTDGLVERRGRDLDSGIDLLAEQIRMGEFPVSEIPARLVATLAPDGTEDDIAILVAGIGSDTAQQTATLDVPATPAAVSEARRFAVSTFRGWSLPDELLQDGALITTELVTNAILHGQPPIRLRLRRTARELAIEVDDAASAMPRKLHAGPDDLHGRGLDIVAQLSSRWAARADGYGKTVWSTLRIRDPAAAPAISGGMAESEASA